MVARSPGEVSPAAAERVPVVSPSNPAAVRRFRPDLVIADDQSAPALRAALKAPVYVVDGTSITGAERDQLAVSLLAGRGPQGRSVVERVRATISRTPARTGVLAPVKAYLDQGAFVPPSVFASQLITAAGGSAITAATPGELRRAAPQVYLSEAGLGTPPHDVRTQADTKNLPASLRGRVHTIPVWWVTTDGPRMGQAVEHLAALLHPRAGTGQ